MSNQQQAGADRRPTLTEVNRSIRAVRELHALGVKIQNWIDKSFPADSRYGQGVAKKAMEQFGLTNEDDVRKALQFVNGKRNAGKKDGVSKADIEALAKLAKQERFLLRVTSIKRLLSVPNHEDRMQLARQMIQNRWSQENLQALIREHNGGPRRSGGRLPRMPETAQQLLNELQRIASKWQRYEDAVVASEEFAELPKKQRNAIREVTKTMIRHGF